VKPKSAVSNGIAINAPPIANNPPAKAHHRSETDEESNLCEAHADYLSSTMKC
jgi:hypothetical protein